MSCTITITDTNGGQPLVLYPQTSDRTDILNKLQEFRDLHTPVTSTMSDSFIGNPKVELMTSNQKEAVSTLCKNYGFDISNVQLYTVDGDICKAFVLDNTPRIVLGKELLTNGKLLEANAVNILSTLADSATHFGTWEQKQEWIETNISTSKDAQEVNKLLNDVFYYDQEKNSGVKTLLSEKATEYKNRFRQWVTFDKKTKSSVVSKDLYSPRFETISKNEIVQGDLVKIKNTEYLYIGEINEMYDGCQYGLNLLTGEVQQITLSQKVDVKQALLFTWELESDRSISTSGLSSVATDPNTGLTVEDRTLLSKGDVLQLADGTKCRVIKRVEDMLFLYAPKKDVKTISANDTTIVQAYKSVDKQYDNPTFNQEIELSSDSMSRQLKNRLLNGVQTGDHVVVNGEELTVLRHNSNTKLQVQDSSGKIFLVEKATVTSLKLQTPIIVDRSFQNLLKDPNSKLWNSNLARMSVVHSLGANRAGVFQGYSYKRNGNTVRDYGAFKKKLPTLSPEKGDILISKTGTELYSILEVNGEEYVVMDNQQNIKSITYDEKSYNVRTTDFTKSTSYIESNYTDLKEYSPSSIEQAFFDFLSKQVGLPVKFVTSEEVDSTHADKLAWTDSSAIYINVSKTVDKHDTHTSILTRGVHEFSHILFAYMRAKSPEAYRAVIEKNRKSNETWEQVEERLVESIENGFTEKWDVTKETGELEGTTGLLRTIQAQFTKMFNLSGKSSNNWSVESSITQMMAQFRGNGIIDMLRKETSDFRGVAVGEQLKRATQMQQYMDQIDKKC